MAVSDFVITPTVSIIINNYNYARFLNSCIDSAMNQTYRKTEVIVVDDGSVDDSRSIIAARSSEMKVVLKVNGGQASAFNAGFGASNGELVMFLDSDDLLLPGAIATIVEFWRPEFTKAQFPLEIIDSEGNSSRLTVPRGRLSRGDVREEILNRGSYSTPPTSGNVYARSFLESIMPMPCQQWRKGADAYLNTLAGVMGQIGSWDSPLGLYRVHGSGMNTIVQEGAVRIEQVRYLMDFHLKLQRLVEETALAHRLTAKKDMLTSNLSHQKLKLTLTRMSRGSGRSRFLATANAASATIRCALSAKQSSISSRIQMIVWAIAVTLSPTKLAIYLIKLAFDLTPKSSLLAAIRRN